MAGKHDNWVTVAPGAQLRGDAAASYLRMRADGMPGNGTAVFRRTFEKQAELRKRYEKGIGPIAARPSWNAPHIQGIALDNNTTVNGKYDPSGTHSWMTKGGSGALRPKVGEKIQSRDYGWTRTVPSERWHFGYDPAKDKHAAADLKKRLNDLGYTGVGALKDFQRNNGLTVDGKAGPATWTKLLTNPTRKPGTKPTPPPAPKPPPTERRFRFGQINFEGRRFGGADDRTAAQGNWVEDVMKVSFFAFQEVDEDARNAMRKAMGKAWWTYPEGYLGVMGNAAWKPLKRASVTFDNKGIHGALRATVKEVATGRIIDVISVHIRPNDAFPADWSDEKKIDGKLGDVRKALTLVRDGVETIFAGDMNTAKAVAVVEGCGKKLKLVHTLVDTGDAVGDQKIDHIYATPGFLTRAWKVVPSSVSDHRALLWQGTLPKSSN